MFLSRFVASALECLVRDLPWTSTLSALSPPLLIHSIARDPLDRLAPADTKI